MCPKYSRKHTKLQFITFKQIKKNIIPFPWLVSEKKAICFQYINNPQILHINSDLKKNIFTILTENYTNYIYF